MGSLGMTRPLSRMSRRAFAKVTFKLDCFRNDGMPGWARPAEPWLQSLNSRVRLFGRHKYLRYAQWFRGELASYLRETLGSRSVQESELWDRKLVRRLADEHISGKSNYLEEINLVLSLDAIKRTLLAPQPARRAVAPALAGV
jgi:Asparagine synthase